MKPKNLFLFSIKTIAVVSIVLCNQSFSQFNSLADSIVKDSIARIAVQNQLMKSSVSNVLKSKSRATVISDGGTNNYITKWTDAANYKIGNGSLYDNGDIGLGTTSPVAELDIRNATYDGTPDAEQTQIAAGLLELSRSSYPYIDFNQSSYGDDYDARFILRNADLLTVDGASFHVNYTSSLSGIQFGVGGKSYFSDHVGIGVTNPAYRLDVQGGNINVGSGYVYKIGGTTVLKYVTGDWNFFVGNGDHSSISGTLNTFIGPNAGSENSSGCNNTCIGFSAGVNNSTGTGNTIVGNSAAFGNYGSTTGSYNTVIGGGAGYDFTSSSYNILVGSGAGAQLTTGGNNTFLGYSNGYGIITGTDNVFIGYKVGESVSSGTSNKLMIDNSDISTPLIYGDFSSNYVYINGNFKVTGILYDDDGDAGSSGQLLSSTGTGTNWINDPGKKLTDDIETMQKKITALENELSMLKTQTDLSSQINTVNSGAELFQNNPNPFSEQTEIKYTVPENTYHAVICIYDMQGKQIKSYSITDKTKGAITINGGELTAGMYFYALLCDGKEICTKKMILTE